MMLQLQVAKRREEANAKEKKARANLCLVSLGFAPAVQLIPLSTKPCLRQVACAMIA